jgi:GGDEF domain-containing protein
MEPMWILIDSRTGLHVAWYFWLRVLDEVNRSTRYGTPFGLLLLEGQIESPQASKRGRQFEESAATLPQAIRSTDLGGLISHNRLVVLLTNQDAASAERARDRILERMEAAGTCGVRWTPTLLHHPVDAAAISHLLTTGWDPVEDADWAAVSQPA